MDSVIGTAISVIGSSHIKKKIQCQDNSLFIEEKNYSVIVVCDGHGGEKHFRSEIGSKYAVEICAESVEEFVNGVSGKREKHRLNEMLENFGKYLVFKWREQINFHYEQNAFSQEELSGFSENEIKDISLNPHIAYGTTLLVVIATKKNTFLIKLGDGEIRLITDSNVINPFECENQYAFGKTDSMCNSDSASKTKYLVIETGEYKSAFIVSDGVYNSFDSNENFERFIITIDANGDDMYELKEMLMISLPELSAKGSGDDVSVSLLKKIKNTT